LLFCHHSSKLQIFFFRFTSRKREIKRKISTVHVKYFF